MYEILLRFVEQAVSLARKLTDAALMQISEPAGKPVSDLKYDVLHFLRHQEAPLSAALNWAEKTERAHRSIFTLQVL